MITAQCSIQCAGNSVWRKGVEVQSTQLNPADMDQWLTQQVDFSLNTKINLVIILKKELDL